ncbi:HupE/UreJ family protein [Piscinibacter sp. Jin2]|uniref:HupE/UreJ family protein n=1 Tax=Aquariibacter lacus TaxID=2801332 RepID=A0A9X0XDL8_9BURK|nr:HupE/UreJ family protein [Piscinibacter lacus]MBL0718867.1 HupE/UreJ family protein [Piscinibacter lacus]
MSLRRCIAWLLAGLLLLAAGATRAHQPSDSLLELRVQGPRIELAWDIALKDLDAELDLDADEDGLLRWREVQARWADIEALAAASLRLGAPGGEACSGLRGLKPQLIEHGAGPHVALRAVLDCGQPPERLQIAYSLFAGSDPNHRGLLRLVLEGQDHALAAVLHPREPARDFALAAGRGPGFLEFLVQGIWHIAIGFDHILFLVALLLVCVLRWDGRAWQPAAEPRAAVAEVLRVVTAFTVAHSITLSLAATGVLALPSRWVEAGIAASVLLAALNNVRPLVQGPRRWMLVAVFGLVHGFGFANVLQDLGLREGELVLPLLGFNLGVELGQLLGVALLLPLAWWARGQVFYRRGVVGGGSLLIAALAAYWFVERAFALE